MQPCTDLKLRLLISCVVLKCVGLSGTLTCSLCSSLLLQPEAEAVWGSDIVMTSITSRICITEPERNADYFLDKLINCLVHKSSVNNEKCPSQFHSDIFKCSVYCCSTEKSSKSFLTSENIWSFLLENDFDWFSKIVTDSFSVHQRIDPAVCWLVCLYLKLWLRLRSGCVSSLCVCARSL